MKPYLVFAGIHYYPTGPGDFVHAFGTLDEAYDVATVLAHLGDPWHYDVQWVSLHRLEENGQLILINEWENEEVNAA